jgi:hypothetical protein
MILLLFFILAPCHSVSSGADTVSLGRGWNLISFSKAPPTDIPTALGSVSPDVLIIWGWESASRQWVKWRPSGGASNTLSSLEAWKGYWIYTDEPGSIEMAGWEWASSRTVPLSDGWNLTGYSGLNNADADTALGTIRDRWNMVWGWESGLWYGKHPAILTLPAPIEPLSSFGKGKAYWVRIRQGQATDWTLPPAPDLNGWLTSHPGVAGAIKWQYRPADLYNVYTPPGDSDKIAWADWNPSQKNDLNQAFINAYAWLTGGARQVQLPYEGLTDQPLNTHPNLLDNSISVMEHVTPAYMWNLYIAHVAFSLAMEVTKQLPWSITGYDDDSLRYLFDSTTMAWGMYWSPSGQPASYSMGTYRIPAKRVDNLPKTAFAPPSWTYPFLVQSGLVGATRIETIGNILDWMRQNLTHFYGNDSFGNMYAVWQYRGYPPISRIVNGTTDLNNPDIGPRHWTAGCHGSVGFLNEVLRTVNIPVQPVWMCDHEMPYFVTEKMYMDHGDDPYNRNVKDSQVPILSLLIDEATYQSWFTHDLTVNITDPTSPACANVGRRAAEAGQ